jgi:hypothetical protein
MKALAVALVCSSAGCLVVNKTTTTTKPVGLEPGDSVPGAIDHVSLGASSSEHTLVVHAVASRTCSRPVNQVFEVRKSEHLGMGGPDDPRAKVFGLFLAPVTIPVSALVSALGKGDDVVSRTTKVDHTEQLPCTTPATQLPLELDLESGAHDRVVTDDKGDVRYTIPLAEPYTGTIVVRDGDVAQKVAYHQPMPALVEAREALTVCGAGAATLALETEISGMVKHAWVSGDGGAKIARCVEGRLARTPFPFHGETIELPFGSEHVVDTARRLHPVCAAIDAERDQLVEADRSSSQRVLARVLERQNQLVVEGDCDETFTAYHERTGAGFVVHVKNGYGSRRTTVAREADLSAAYEELIPALVELEPLAHATAVPVPVVAATEAHAASALDPEPEHDAAPEVTAASEPTDSATESVLYASVGVGSVRAFGLGYRYRSGALGLDLAGWLGQSQELTAGAVKGELLLFTSPHTSASWYFGTGLSLGGYHDSEYEMSVGGSGVSWEGSMGFQFPLGKARSFVQADVSVPGYKIDYDTGGMGSPPTMFIVSWGFGANLATLAH